MNSKINNNNKLEIEIKNNDLIIIFLGAGFELNFGVKSFELFYKKYYSSIQWHIEKNICDLENEDLEYLEWIFNNKDFNYFKKFSLLKKFEKLHLGNNEILKENFKINLKKEEERDILFDNFIKNIKLNDNYYSTVKIITTNLSNFLNDEIEIQGGIIYLNKINDNIYITEEDFFVDDYIKHLDEQFEKIEDNIKKSNLIYWYFYGYSFSDYLIVNKIKKLINDEDYKNKYKFFIYDIEKKDSSNFKKYLGYNLFSQHEKFNYFVKSDGKEVFKEFLEHIKNPEKIFSDEYSDKIIKNFGIKDENIKKNIRKQSEIKEETIEEVDRIANGNIEYKNSYSNKKLKYLGKEFNWKSFIDILRMSCLNFFNDKNWLSDFLDIIFKNKGKLLDKNDIDCNDKNLFIEFIMKAENKYSNNFLDIYRFFILQKKYVFLFDWKINPLLLKNNKILKIVLEVIINIILNSDTKNRKRIQYGLYNLSNESFKLKEDFIWNYIKKYIEKNVNKIMININYNNNFNYLYFLEHGIFFNKFYILFIYELSRKESNYYSWDYYWDSFDYDNVDSIINSKRMVFKIKTITEDKENFWDTQYRFSKDDFDNNFEQYWEKILSGNIILNRFSDFWLIKYILDKKRIDKNIINELFDKKVNLNNKDCILESILSSNLIDINKYIISQIEKENSNLNNFSKYSILNLLNLLYDNKYINKYEKYFIDVINNSCNDKEFDELDSENKLIKIATINEYLNKSKKCKIINFFKEKVWIINGYYDIDITRRFIDKINWEPINLFLLSIKYGLGLSCDIKKINKDEILIFFDFLFFNFKFNVNIIRDNNFWKLLILYIKKNNERNNIDCDYFNISILYIFINIKEEKSIFLEKNDVKNVLESFDEERMYKYIQHFFHTKINKDEDVSIFLGNTFINKYILGNERFKYLLFKNLLEIISSNLFLHKSLEYKNNMFKFIEKNIENLEIIKLDWYKNGEYEFQNFIDFLYKNKYEIKEMKIIIKKWFHNNKGKNFYYYERNIKDEDKLFIVFIKNENLSKFLSTECEVDLSNNFIEKPNY